MNLTPLNSAHEALNAKMAPFAGYAMPIQYAGVIAETEAVRKDAGMFDVSHMARLHLTGERVFEFVQWVTSNEVAKLTDSRGQYSLLPNASGGVVDDIIVYRLSADHFLMVVNAANHAKDIAWLNEQNSFGVNFEDVTDSTAMLAVQGPNATAKLAALSGRASVLTEQPMFGVCEADIAGVLCTCMRSGYTGEDGFEIFCQAAEALKLWDALLAAGIAPCGLGARDVLRVEAGLPLYGHELSDDLSPISAGLGWVVGKEKLFIGCEHIRAAQTQGVAQKVQGVKLNGKRLPMPGMTVYVNDNAVGEVTSGVYSPTLGCGIAFALVDAAVALQTPCELDMRGKREPGTIVSKRFLKRETPA